ncbi:unnamed protein product [Lymnaea stagnalis]|uniref:Regulator of G-protein signaling 12 n=1 Tax=Lymnaea stagnalis TaxID=6523 RepID=A0AAV2IA63_LYMST
MNLVANSGRSAFQVPRPVSAPLVKHRIQNRPETVDLETLGKLSPRAFPHTSPTSSVFRSPSAPPAPFFPHRDSDSDDDDDEDDDEEDESEDDPYIRQILEQFKKDRKAAMDEDSRRFSEGFALSKKRDKDKHEVGNIQKWTKAGSLRRAQHTMLKQSLSHSHESLAVGEDGSSSNQKLITACSVNNIACQTGDQGLIEKSGRVASWAVNFEKLLKDPIGIGIFTNFLKKEFSEENVIFWKACEQYRQLADDHQRKSQAKDIYSRYLSTKASDPVNVDSAARSYSEKFLDNPTAIMFDVAQQQIFQLMRQDSYARFLKSDLYKNKLMEEMEGKVLEGTAEERKFSDSKKKGKGKENDDKRRRSILPWKQNRKSVKSTSDPELKKHGKKGKEDKDKETNNNHQNISVVSSGTTTTITTSSNANGVNNVNLKKAPGPGIDLSTMRKEVFHLKELKDAPEVNFKFCRIVMPDGSTTVVCAKPGQTSRSVLSKLCEKRSISIASVDVFLLGSDRPLDLNEDISTLGSKEIVIERRVLFRLDFPNNKSIGVKAKPNRSIRDVFKPILSKYGFRIDNIAVHLIGSMDFLDLDMSVSDIENQRVVVITDVEAAEIMRQGAQPTVSRLPKAPPASRSKAGHFGTRGGSLEEITNKIFEDLMRGKSQLAHGFDELGVLELDKAKAHKNEEGRSLALFGLLRKESVPAKEASKTSKLKGKVTFSLPKNESKKKGSAKEGERLFEMLSSAQKMRLEEQRGVLVTPGELPSFLCEDIKSGCVDEDQNIVEEIHMKKIDDAQCGLNMFDDVAEISKAGFLEKKKHELFNYPRSTYSSNFTPRETNKIINKTPTSEKWKLHVDRNLHQDGVVTSPGEADTYFRMSPLVIDSKNATQSSDNNLKNNLSLNMRAPVASPENFSPDSKKLRSSPEGKNSVLLASPLPDKLSPNSISSPETPKTSLHYSNKNFTSVNQTTSYETGKLNLATENKSPSPQILSPSKNKNMDFFHQQQAHEMIKNEFNGKDNFSNKINSFHSFGKSPGTTQTNNHFLIGNGTSDTREALHSPDIDKDHHGRMIQHKIQSPTRDLSQRALMSPRFELSPKYRRPDPPPYKKRSSPFTSPNIKPDTDNSNSTSQGLSPPIPVFNSPDTVTKRPGSNQPFTEQPAVSPSVFQFVDNRNLLHSNHYQNSPHPILNSAKFILLPYQNTDQEEETVTFV